MLLGPEDGAPNFAMRRFTMGEGGGMPLHVNAVEHEQYVLRGRARVGIGDTVHEVGADDVLYIPAGEPHFYEVVEAPFEFLCVVPNEQDQIMILDPVWPGCHPPRSHPGQLRAAALVRLPASALAAFSHNLLLAARAAALLTIGTHLPILPS